MKITVVWGMCVPVPVAGGKVRSVLQSHERRVDDDDLCGGRGVGVKRRLANPHWGGAWWTCVMHKLQVLSCSKSGFFLKQTNKSSKGRIALLASKELRIYRAP